MFRNLRAGPRRLERVVISKGYGLVFPPRARVRNTVSQYRKCFSQEGEIECTKRSLVRATSRVTQTCFSATLLGYYPNDLHRKTQKKGMRPLRLHDARHIYASLALASGKSVRWVAEQLGHSDPALTLRVYAHAMREEESDLSFADFGGSERPYPAPTRERDVVEAGNCPERLARREGEQAQLASKPYSQAAPAPPQVRSPGEAQGITRTYSSCLAGSGSENRSV
jgi:hypothetical protein